MSTCTRCGTKYEDSLFSAFLICPDCDRLAQLLEAQRKESQEAKYQSDRRSQAQIDAVNREQRRNEAAAAELDTARFNDSIQGAMYFLAADMYEDATRATVDATAHVKEVADSIDVSAMFVHIGVRNNKSALVSVHGSKLIELLQRYCEDYLTKGKNGEIPFTPSWLSRFSKSSADNQLGVKGISPFFPFVK